MRQSCAAEADYALISREFLGTITLERVEHTSNEMRDGSWVASCTGILLPLLLTTSIGSQRYRVDG